MVLLATEGLSGAWACQSTKQYTFRWAKLLTGTGGRLQQNLLRRGSVEQASCLETPCPHMCICSSPAYACGSRSCLVSSSRSLRLSLSRVLERNSAAICTLQGCGDFLLQQAAVLPAPEPGAGSGGTRKSSKPGSEDAQMQRELSCPLGVQPKCSEG